MKQLLFHLLLIMVGLSGRPSVFAQADDSGAEQLEEAAIFLEGRLPFATSPQAKLQIQLGIESLRSIALSASEHEDSSSADSDFQPTTRNFKRKLQGLVAFNEKTGELSIVYNFRNARQIEDFRGDGALIRQGLLMIEAGKTLEHIVKFKEFAVLGTVKLSHDDGNLISTTGGLVMKTSNPSQRRFWLEILAEPGNRGRNRIAGVQVLPDGGSGNAQSLLFGFKVEGETVSANVGPRTIGGPVGELKEPTGAITIGPYQGPFVISGLQIVGKVDPVWAVKFLEN